MYVPVKIGILILILFEDQDGEFDLHVFIT